MAPGRNAEPNWDGSARVRAYAKVNLGLRVLDRRPDGFHSLRTVFQTVGLYDDVVVSIRTGAQVEINLNCDRTDLNHPGNLAWHAADLLLRRMQAQTLVRIDLRKRIPSGAGLGGGSSDAAAVLRALGLLLSPRPADRVLFEVAREIGSDVPYFLVGGTVAGTGRGTELAPRPEQGPRPIALALPDVEVSTAWAYRALDQARELELTSSGPSNRLNNVRSAPAPSRGPAGNDLAERMTNDFESVVFDRFPALGEIKREVLSLGAQQALLSGSGSAVFGMFDSLHSASHAASHIAARGIRAEAVRFVSRSDVNRSTRVRGAAARVGCDD